MLSEGLTLVTLTGADDTVDPQDLLELSRLYPFVEWGILFGSRSGVARFPSDAWISSLATAVTAAGFQPHLSAHLCGKRLDDVVIRAEMPPIPHIHLFGRVQLNFHGDQTNLQAVSNIVNAIQANEPWKSNTPEIIVQLDGVNDWLLDHLLVAIRASGLYDTSHGAGVKPEVWPKANKRWKVGYAGGLGPETIWNDLRAIKQAAGQQSFWIDMETKLRDLNNRCNVFDMNRCRVVLEECSRKG